MAINAGKVIAGGLVGGVVANVIDFIWNTTVMKADMVDLGKRFGMPDEALNSFATAAPWLIVDFIFGFVIVFTYAAMRPRLGPGPKTAMIAGLMPYIAVTAVLWGFQSMGMMPMASFVKGSATALVTTIVGSL